MRVAIIVPTLRIGGAEAASARLANELSNVYAEVTLIVLLGNMKNGVNPLGETVDNRVGIKYLNSKSMGDAILRLRNYLKQNKLDVIQSMIRGSNFVLLLSSIGIKNYSIVLREANIILFPDDGLIKKFKTIVMLNVFYRFSDAIICNCIHASASLAKIVVFSKVPISTLANPVVPEEYFNDEFVKHIHLKRERGGILCVSRHNRQKDIAILLRAFSNLLQKSTNAKLTIVGEGPLLAANKSLARELNISKSVVFIDRVHPLNEMYLKYETFVLPSKWEGTPNSMVEALVSGMKVVSFEALGCAAELVRVGNGNVAAERNELDLAKALEASLDSDFPCQMLRLKSLRQFQASVATDQFVALYARIRCV